MSIPSNTVNKDTTNSKIEVFSTIGCKFCKKVKSKLSSIRVNYRNIDINEPSTYQGSRDNERVAFAKANTVPQIYIDDIWLGGCDAIVSKLEDESLFQLFDDNDIIYNKNAHLDDDYNNDGHKGLILPSIEQPNSGEALNTITFNINESLQKQLDKVDTIISSDDDGKISPLLITTELQKRALTLVDQFGSWDGSRINYKMMKGSDELKLYIAIATKLSNIPLESILSLTNTQKFAFFANLYNAFIVHATCILGACEDTPTARTAFFSGNSGAIYNVCGINMSPDQMEHGILRCNRRHPGQSSDTISYLSSTDPVNQLTLPINEFDPRIHFILNCGASSCPPIKILEGSKEQLEAALSAASKAYLEKEISCDSDGDSSNDNIVIKLPRLCMWYGYDFGNSLNTQISTLLSYLQPAHSEAILKMLSTSSDVNDINDISFVVDEPVGTVVVKGDEIKVNYNFYNWASNAV